MQPSESWSPRPSMSLTLFNQTHILSHVSAHDHAARPQLDDFRHTEQDKYQSDVDCASVEHGRLNGPNWPYAYVLLR